MADAAELRERNRKAASVRQQLAQRRLEARSHAPLTPQEHLEARMAGAEYGAAPVKAPTLSEILARVNRAVAARRS